MVSKRFLVSSIPLLEAASISIKSIAAPSLMDLHESQRLHGSPFFKSLQFKAFANILAMLVFPVSYTHLTLPTRHTV